MVDDRIKANVVLAGKGSADKLSKGGKQRLPYYGGDFSTMTMPALTVYGDEDASPWFTSYGTDWHADTFALAPGPKDLLIVKGGNHILGGISGWDVRETMEDSVERVSIVQRMTWAYMRSQLYGDDAWVKACAAFTDLDRGRLEHSM